jgi:deoxyribodipyrimidine photo-lyase
MSKKITIHWFRQDLRLHDNPSLYNASEEGEVIPIFILDNVSTQKYQLGSASKWWLYHSLLSLQKSLGGKLNYYIGDPKEILLNYLINVR